LILGNCCRPGNCAPGHPTGPLYLIIDFLKSPSLARRLATLLRIRHGSTAAAESDLETKLWVLDAMNTLGGWPDAQQSYALQTFLPADIANSPPPVTRAKSRDHLRGSHPRLLCADQAGRRLRQLRFVRRPSPPKHDLGLSVAPHGDHGERLLLVQRRAAFVDHVPVSTRLNYYNTTAAAATSRSMPNGNLVNGPAYF